MMHPTIRKLRTPVLVSLVTVAIVAAAAVAVTRAGDDADDGDATPAASAAVERRDVTIAETLAGTLTYQDVRELSAGSTGTVTGLPEVGDVVSSGEVIAWIDGTPVVLLTGEVPAWRDLAEDGPGLGDLEVTEANARAAQAQRDQLQAGPTGEQQRVSDLQVERAELQVVEAEAAVETARALHDAALDALDQQVEAARLALDQAEADRELALESLDQQVAAAENQLARAQELRDLVDAAEDCDANPDDTSCVQARHRVQEAREGRDAARLARERGRLGEDQALAVLDQQLEAARQAWEQGRARETQTLMQAQNQLVQAEIARDLAIAQAALEVAPPGPAELAQADAQVTQAQVAIEEVRRDLAPGVADGPDVEQLEAALLELGYGQASDSFPDQTWDAETTEAVRQFQADRGMEPTGRLEAGQVVFAAGDVRVAGHTVPLGDEVQPGTTLLTVSSTERAVTVELDPGDRDLVTRGSEVAVELPTGERVPATVHEIATTVDTAGQNGGETISVEILLDDPDVAADFDHAPVTVRVDTPIATDVLAVPVAAIVVAAGGEHAVDVVAPDGTTRRVPVTLGAWGDGYVEVVGDLEEGDRVVAA